MPLPSWGLGEWTEILESPALVSGNLVEMTGWHNGAQKAQAGKLFSETPVAPRACDWLGLEGLHGWNEGKGGAS